MKTAVVMAVYNGIKFLKPQLDSILQQTLPADEVLIADDGSTDGSVELIEDYIRSHHLAATWQVYRNEQNLGYIKNFYQLMLRTDSDLIFLADQDDIWAKDKLQVMTRLMAANEKRLVLASAFGVIDADDESLKGLLIEKSAATKEVSSVTAEDIFRSYHWPGMAMAVRGDFGRAVAQKWWDIKVPHDLVLALCAAERDGFCYYDDCTCYHRNHGDNVAAEEHRIGKVLNRNRKLREMAGYNAMLSALSTAGLVSAETAELIRAKLAFSRERERCVGQRKLFSGIKLYVTYRKAPLRSFLCDMWLICFGGKD